MRSNVPKGRAQWTRIVENFERGQLTQAEFCDAHGLNLGTFRTWLYRLRREQGEREQGRPKLVELVPAPVRDAPACVVRVGTAEMRFAVRPEVEYLGALLRVVEER